MSRREVTVMFPDISCDDIFRLETPRLWLRWLRASDAPAVASFAGLAEVARMTASIPHPYPGGEAERFILHARALTAAGQALVLTITLKNKTRSVIGLVSAQEDGASTAGTRPPDVEIGYVVTPAQAGHGFATEATAALVDTIFDLTSTARVHATSRVGNAASRRVLEKCGFRFTETTLIDLPARGGRHPCDCFERLRGAWQRSRERSLPGMEHQAPQMQAPGDARQGSQ